MGHEVFSGVGELGGCKEESAAVRGRLMMAHVEVRPPNMTDIMTCLS